MGRIIHQGVTWLCPDMHKYVFHCHSGGPKPDIHFSLSYTLSNYFVWHDTISKAMKASKLLLLEKPKYHVYRYV